MRRSLSLAPIALLLISCGQPEPANIMVSDAWARATAPGAKMGAVYATIENRGGTSDRLTKVDSDRAMMAMVHDSSSENGVMRMRAVGPLDIPAGGSVALAPGAKHIMLEGLQTPLVAGQKFSIIVTFEASGARTVPVTVVAPGER